MRRLLLISLASALALIAAGCSSGEPAANAADRAFAEQMIVHHEQAIEMSELVDGSDASDDVTRLAEQIAAAQGPEITQMQRWLDEWDDDHAGHGDETTDDHAGHGAHGMMTDEQMAELRSATGPAFDRLWLSLMIEHHEGAVAMAQTVLEDGAHSDVRDLAEQIIADQTDEIAHMKELLDE